MIVALTGGSGFIGRYLVQHHRSKGDLVRVLTRNPRFPWGGGVEVHIGDLGRDDRIPTAFLNGVDVLYHCAAELHDTSRMHAVNVEGTARLIEAAHGRIGRWVQLSSVGAYGAVQSGVITELSPERPVGPYERTKTQADSLVIEAAGQGAFEVAVLRPSNVYGEGMPNQSLFQLFSMIERGWFFFLGPKGASANYVHVNDVVEGLVLCATHPAAAGQTFNVSNWSTMEAAVENVADALGRLRPRLRLPLAPVRLLASTLGVLPKVPLTSARVDALSCRSRYATEKIEQKLNYGPRISVPEGFANLALWWKNHKTPT